MRNLTLCFILSATFILPFHKAHALDPKGKAFMVICTYGTVSGALLGFATMAFGTNSRAIAQGASLGLYAGIAFGSYVISSHKKSLEPMTPGQDFNGAPPPPGPGFGREPVPNGFGQEPPSGFGDEPGSDSGGFFGTPQRFMQINDEMVYNYKLKNEKGRDFSMPIYVNFFNASF